MQAPPSKPSKQDTDAVIDHTIPVVEERVAIGRRRIETGRTRVVKRVRERVAVVAEPTIREDVRVERRPINRAVSPDAMPVVRQEGDRTIIPVIEEVVVVERRLVLREELHVIRTRRTEVHPQRVVLRSEEAAVERTPSARDIGATNHVTQGVSMTHSVAAVFEDRATAEAARDDLLQAGFSGNQVSIQASDTLPEDVRTRLRTDREEGAIEHFFRSLFGFEEDTSHYAEATRRGLSVVVVFTEEDEGVNRAHEVLARLNPTDVEDHAERWREDGWNPPTAAALSARPEAHMDTTRPAAARVPPTTAGVSRETARSDVSEEQHIPVIREELQVGKRVVRRGGVRVYASVVEQPVEEAVRLREEQAFVERRPVDRPATEGDLGTFQEGTLEVRESVEEPVVQKSRRVVEEIDVGKRARERTETVRDTVKRTDVRVENLDEAPVADRGKQTIRKDTDKPR